ncbi:MAG TPA: hypothetical protein VH590_01240, partial [Ktedonobacterales bacterium]
VTLILFLFPALVVPLFLIAFLTRLPGDVGTFFTDYSAAFLWGIYFLLIAGGAAFLYYLKRRGHTARQAAESAAEPAAADEERAMLAEAPQE